MAAVKMITLQEMPSPESAVTQSESAACMIRMSSDLLVIQKFDIIFRGGNIT